VSVFLEIVGCIAVVVHDRLLARTVDNFMAQASILELARTAPKRIDDSDQLLQVGR